MPGETARARHVPRRRFGQNFLVDRNVVGRILAAVDPARGDRVVEIGPGLGALTGPLLDNLDRLIAVEVDRDCVARLQEEHPGERLEIHCADALRFDFGALGADLRLVGNLPYNISTPLLFHLARWADRVRDMHFMLQKEVVERMVARAATAEYGRLSVMLQYRFRIEKLFEISPGSFRPAPQVRSAFVRLTPHAPLPHPAGDEMLFREIVTRSFSARRKTLRNALLGLANREAFAAAGIDPEARGETLGVEEFVRLANRLGQAAR